ncbi:MAG: Rrf2 family transcriptional regulator [Phycisphaerae bacterium]
MKSKYAIKALLFLAKKRDAGPTLIADLAQREKIPKKFLEAILLDLKNEGILQSRKGKNGGYLLVAAPNKIKVGRIIEIFDGVIAAPTCVSQSMVRNCSQCDEQINCGLRLIMNDLRNSIESVLLDTTLADINSRMELAEVQNGRSVMFHI